MLSSLSFRYPFRKYQRMILAQVESGQGDNKYHIVAPPGSGKTIVGLELIRRFGYPAVVFTPTSTIQAQWREKVGMFVEPSTDSSSYGGSSVNVITSLDPKRLASINIFTYQLISTPGESQEWVREMAERRWIDDLLHEGIAADEGTARARVDTLHQNNPRAYRKELSRRYLRIKRELLGSQEVDIAQFLHPNARRLIKSLIDFGVRTVVLDECHHLLDYWAIVLRYLLQQISDPRIIGLTATLPDPEDKREYENYTSLLGDVDFEIPTPPVVKEGDLAPYRDLVYFVSPNKREMAFLNNIQTEFEDAISELTETQKFRGWVIETVIRRTGKDGNSLPWQEFLDREPLLSLAGTRFLRRIGYTLPSHLILPVETENDLSLDDWITLLERYGLEVLKISSDPEDHSKLTHLRKILLSFGFTLTERGLRQSRSPGDLVLSFSEAKDQAVAHILARESGALGDRLRAVVVTDFERMSSGVKRLKGVLERDAGSARRVFRHLVNHPEAGKLEPVLVTGRTLLVDADHGPQLLERFNAYLQSKGFRASCFYRETDAKGVLEVDGEGPDWSSRTYVRMVTEIFERGITRCLVGTRGIFGEGWDSLSLNTLIDLTSVTTSTSVQQLRGRSIRKDPNWPRKVAHNWDVVCIAKKFDRGDIDLRRFVRRHARFWGIVAYSHLSEILGDAARALQHTTNGLGFSGAKLVSSETNTQTNFLGSELDGQIVKGVSHVSPHLAHDLWYKPIKWINFGKHNHYMLRQVNNRDKTYNLWRIGDDYSNFSYSATTLDVSDMKIRTVFTISNTIKKMLRAFRASILGGITLSLYFGCQVGVQSWSGSVPLEMAFLIAGIILVLGTAVTFLLNLRQAYRLARAFLIEQPPDYILLDVGRALLEALKISGLVSRNLQEEYIRVVEEPDSSFRVLLDYASPEDSTIFIRAYREIFELVRDQRYLILRDDSRLTNLGLTSLWFVLRRWFRDTAGYEPAYHPVPKVLSTRKERAQFFARGWEKYVGGGKLIFTRSETGRRMLLHARAQRRPKVKSMAFEVWR